MEDTRFIKSVFIWGGILLAIPFFTLSYDEKTTHPALTQEIVKFFNVSFPQQAISDSDAELVIKGSIEEDAFGRWMRHFYDPVYNQGVDYFGKTWQSSKDWAGDTIAQATYKITDIPDRTLYGRLKDFFSGETDYSWERGVYEYAWGDKKRALEALGHTLHLIEDASVPDHTRNDPHPGFGTKLQEKFAGKVPEAILNFLDHSETTNASPYESFAKFNRGVIRVVDKILNERPPILSSLNDYFESIARYSNNNFFSKDTIFNPRYSRPLIKFERKETLSNSRKMIFGYNIDGEGNNFRLVGKRSDAEWINLIEGETTDLFLIDDDHKILTNYWERLSRQAVLHGAGVVKLFFDEVEKERQSKVLYDKNRSWLAKQLDKFKSATFRVANLFYGISVSERDLNEGAAVIASLAEPQSVGNPAPSVPEDAADSSQPAQSPPSQQNITAPPLPPRRPTPPPPAPSPGLTISSNVPIAGAGAGMPSSRTETSQTESSSSNSATDTTPPNPPTISTPSANGQTFTTTGITFSGQAEAGSTISQSFSSTTTAADALGNWSLALSGLAQGTTTIEFFATDSSGNRSAASSRSVFIDSVAPDAALTVTECATSLSPTGCLTASTTLRLSWSSTSSDTSYFIPSCAASGIACSGFSSATTTATSTTYTIPTDNTTYSFTLKSVDQSGNESAAQTKTVEVATRPLVVNEIAWAGTGSSATTTKDEWIELFNPTAQTLDLTGFQLRSAFGGFTIALTGILAPATYYLIERTDDTTIIDLTASTTAPFGLGLLNSGDELTIEYGGGVVDRTPTIATCSGWCAGAAGGQYFSMERYDPWASGTTSSNWGTWTSFLRNGTNVEGDPVNGTPGKRNSINHLIDKSGTFLGTSKTLSKTLSPYIIPGSLTIGAAATLTIPTGVVVKFYPSASLTVDGALVTQGTASEPVVFTSFHDDTYAGDTNANGTTTAPAIGDWLAITIRANGSSLDQTVIRYGGQADLAAAYWAILRVENTSLTLRNSVVEYSRVYGAWFKNAGGTIESNIFRNNNFFALGQTDGVGLVITSGAPTVRNNQFLANRRGLLVDAGTSATPVVENNTFSGNASYAIQVIGAYPTFAGNTASGNGVNGIQFQGSLGIDYTLSANLTYLIQSTTVSVPAGRILTIAPGAVVKFDGSAALSVSGTLNAAGTPATPIIFTSFHDDTYGGDTNATTTAPAAGDWDGITLQGSAASSTLSHFVLRYGGNQASGALGVSGIPIAIQNATIEYNKSLGLSLTNAASSTLSDVTIQHHREPIAGTPIGLSLSNTAVTLTNTTFRDNTLGIQSTNGSSVINGGGIVFDGNTTNTSPPGLIP